MANTCTATLALSVNANTVITKPALQLIQNPTDTEQI